MPKKIDIHTQKNYNSPITYNKTFALTSNKEIGMKYPILLCYIAKSTCALSVGI